VPELVILRSQTGTERERERERERAITVDSEPFIQILSRRKSYCFPQVSTAQGRINVLSKLRTLHHDKLEIQQEYCH